ncbi:TonB-dependent receptor plug domain-containing protein [Bacteroides timonensis]|uniref:TonB-dependent receptor plug domain-containing protein n=1 Tax=Bacteroides timonensis TaxID=1470345 RepID=UPI001FCC803B|nr:TonB-dependent receptor plug domain-containing protein [Bacteroides timonensis]
MVLLSLPDSTFVTGTTSGEDGTFNLSVTAEHQIVRISSIGYTTIYRPVSSANIGTIQLTSDTQLLNEVTIKADLPKIRLKGDAMVTTVTGSVLEKSGTGNDLLDKIPGVSAEDGAVNVFGQGAAEIYINGRKVRNSSELDQLSSDNVKSVEVVRNPGARYDASVKAVVRIITKKCKARALVLTTAL